MTPASKRVCLLTGAGGRLGSAFCRLFADRYHIAAVYRHKPPEVATQNQRYVDPLRPRADLAENAHPVFTLQADLSHDSELDRIVEVVLARYERIDVLINGAVHYAFGPVDSDLLLDSLSLQFNINTVAPVKLAARVARGFWRNREEENRRLNRGVINISSFAGLYISPNLGHSGYSASKAALNYLTLHMANEFQVFGVRVNASVPTSFPERVSAETVARSVARLEEGRMTGKLLAIDERGERFI